MDFPRRTNLSDLLYDSVLPDTLIRPNAERDRAIGKYKRFMTVAQAYASLSKYPGTKVGCAIFGKRFEPLSSGWNGAPRGSKADEDGRLADRETRLLWACHAEANAIANAAASGVSLVDSVMVVTLHPCMTCAKLAVQAGVILVICPKPDDEMELKWGGEFQTSRELFKECGVDLIEFDTTEQ